MKKATAAVRVARRTSDTSILIAAASEEQTGEGGLPLATRDYTYYSYYTYYTYLERYDDTLSIGLASGQACVDDG